MTDTKPPLPRPDQTITIGAGDRDAALRPEVRVDVEGRADAAPAVFTSRFRMGRGEECDVRVEEAPVSRIHAEVSWHDGDWWLRDIESRNGLYLNGTRIAKAALAGVCRVQLGAEGPLVVLTVARPGEADGGTEPTTSFYVQHYLEGADHGEAGERTMMIRKAFAEVSGRRQRRWFGVVATITGLLVAAGAYAVYQHRELERQGRLAEQVFYDTKALELQLAALEEELGATAGAGATEQLEAGRDQLDRLRSGYQRMIEELGVYGDDVPEERRLILRIAGVFGECELVMPPELIAEVERHIELWRADTRLEQAIERAAENDYGPRVAAAMVELHLPPQFFYVALQESDLRTQVCGPKTRYGIAKGPWQFIPGTARAYGLKTGPLYLLRQPDPNDERHDFDRATGAAARYLHDLYTKQAQASGLLVIASYNWGETNVRRLIGQMPENPRERNFWRLFVDHRSSIPKETYNYVLRIFSAAVVGEDPQLFGFDFQNPLQPSSSSPHPTS